MHPQAGQRKDGRKSRRGDIAHSRAHRAGDRGIHLRVCHVFHGKNLVSGGSGRAVDSGGGAAKNGRPNAGKAFVNNNLLNVDKELKKNKKQEDYGFIPSSWKLVRIGTDGKEAAEIASGVADFCLVRENGAKRSSIPTAGTFSASARAKSAKN